MKIKFLLFISIIISGLSSAQNAKIPDVEERFNFYIGSLKGNPISLQTLHYGVDTKNKDGALVAKNNIIAELNEDNNVSKKAKFVYNLGKAPKEIEQFDSISKKFKKYKPLKVKGLRSWSEFKYNKAKKVSQIEEITYVFKNITSKRIFYKYNSKDSLTNIRHEDSQGNDLKIKTYTYNANQLPYIYSFLVDEILVERSETKYNGKLKEKEVFYDRDNEVNFTLNFEYDDKNQVVIKSKYSKTEELLKTTKFTYFDNGKLQLVTENVHSGENEGVYSNTYDNEGKLLEHKVKNPSGEVITHYSFTYEFDANQNVVKAVQTDALKDKVVAVDRNRIIY